MKADKPTKAESEARFYREQLELIAKDKRRTRGRRIAESALTFWDAMARKSKSQNCEQ